MKNIFVHIILRWLIVTIFFLTSHTSGSLIQFPPKVKFTLLKNNFANQLFHRIEMYFELVNNQNITLGLPHTLTRSSGNSYVVRSAKLPINDAQNIIELFSRTNGNSNTTSHFRNLNVQIDVGIGHLNTMNDYGGYLSGSRSYNTLIRVHDVDDCGPLKNLHSSFGGLIQLRELRVAVQNFPFALNIKDKPINYLPNQGTFCCERTHIITDYGANPLTNWNYHNQSFSCTLTMTLIVSEELLDVDTALRLFLFSRNMENWVQVKEKAIQVLKLNFSALQNSEKYRRLVEEDNKAAMELERCVFSG